MNFFKSIFIKKEIPINSYTDFWNWFEQNEKKFYKVLKKQGDINKVFFNELAPKLDKLKDGFWFLAGMCDENTAELILTADGVIKNIVFVEELVQFAPQMKYWKITALKQPSSIDEVGIELDGYKFDESTIEFYSNVNKHLPDEIDITITHKDFCEENRIEITNGIYLALDIFLGELTSATSIDNIEIINPKDATADLIPLKKLKPFLNWREKEFVEKYNSTKLHTEEDSYSGITATLDNGLPLVALINKGVLNWDCKASHPWIAVVEIKYDAKDNNGMPEELTYQLLNEIEDKILDKLKDYEGYLYVGRQTADSIREIYFACVEFRRPSKTLFEIQKEYLNQIELDFDIYKDKYWQSFNRFISY